MSVKTSTVDVARARVDFASAEAARYWCEKFDCTPTELEKAVCVVGDSPEAVERILEIEKQFALVMSRADSERVIPS